MITPRKQGHLKDIIIFMQMRFPGKYPFFFKTHLPYLFRPKILITLKRGGISCYGSEEKYFGLK